MKFSDAIKHYEQGKPIRLKSWPPGCKFQKDQTSSYMDVSTFSQEWELFDDSVEVQTLKEGDLFECHEEKYRVLPAYMLQYTAGRNIASGYQPVINHRTGKLDYISSNGKVKKVNE